MSVFSSPWDSFFGLPVFVTAVTARFPENCGTCNTCDTHLGLPSFGPCKKWVTGRLKPGLPVSETARKMFVLFKAQTAHRTAARVATRPSFRPATNGPVNWENWRPPLRVVCSSVRHSKWQTPPVEKAHSVLDVHVHHTCVTLCGLFSTLTVRKVPE